MQIEALAGMVLADHTALVDYEPGPENCGMIITVPESFYAADGGEKLERAPAEKPGSLEMNGNALVMGGRECTFTPSEAALMKLLVLRFGRAVKKKHLHDELYQLDPNGGADEKIIDVYITKIRAKLREHMPKLAIVTHHGMGFELRNAVAA